MSLVISVYVGEGIVLAGDSRSSFNAAYKTIGKDGHPEKEVHHHSIHVSDTTYKVFVTNSHVGILTCGDASVLGIPIVQFIENYIRLHNEDDVDKIAHSIGDYFHAIDSHLNTHFIVAGYIQNEDSTFEQRVYQVFTAEEMVNPRNEVGRQGAIWDGITDILSRLMQNIAYKVKGKYIDGEPVEIMWNFFTLQDAIDFAQYAIKVTIDTLKFQKREKSVGGPIDILVLKPGSHQWIAHKELHL